MIKKIAVLVNSLLVSELSYNVLKFANKLSEDKNLNVVVFTQNVAPSAFENKVAVMTVDESFKYSGTFVTTDLDTTKQALKCLNVQRLIFYVYDLEFMRGKNDFLKNNEIYRDDKVELVCRSESHAKVLRNYSNKDVQVKSLEEVFNEIK